MCVFESLPALAEPADRAAMVSGLARQGAGELDQPLLHVRIALIRPKAS